MNKGCTGAVKNGLYQLPSQHNLQGVRSITCLKIMVNSLLLHNKLGHPHTNDVKKVAASMNKELTSLIPLAFVILTS